MLWLVGFKQCVEKLAIGLRKDLNFYSIKFEISDASKTMKSVGYPNVRFSMLKSNEKRIQKLFII